MSLLEEYVDQQVLVVTADGRNYVGVLRGFDQTLNLILDECHERVYSGAGVEQMVLGLFIIRGDNIVTVGEVDPGVDQSIDFSQITAPPLKPQALNLESYKSISSKNKKKRFTMRKPNLTDAISQFTQLSHSFRHEGSPHYSAFCSLAVARCEQAMHSESSQEAGHYYEAGTTYWDAAVESETKNYTGIENEVAEAINSYLLAIKIYINHQRYGIAGQLYSEMGHYLSKIGNHSLAAEFTAQSAILRQRDSPMTAARLWYDTANYRISAIDYKSACDCLLNCIKILSTVARTPSQSTLPMSPPQQQQQQIQQQQSKSSSSISSIFSSSSSSSSISSSSSSSSPLAINLTAAQSALSPGEQSISISTHSQMLLEARISLILLHILQDMFLSAKDHIGKLVLDDEMRESSDDVVSLLQMLVTACERKEPGGLYVIQRELWHSLTPVQNELLYSIINTYHLLL